MDLSKFEAKSPVETQGNLRLTRMDSKEKNEHVYAVKYSPCGKYFAATYGNGVCRIYDVDHTPLNRAKLGPAHHDLPSTSVKFLPTSESGELNFVSASSAGAVYGWEYQPKTGAAGFVDKTFCFKEENNDTASIDVDPNGKQVVSGGSDRTVRLYDIETKKLIASMNKGVDDGGHSRPAHTNRIFSVKFASETTLLTGGWECPVQVWDMRTNKAERQLGGPQVASDGIEILHTQGNRCVIASARNNKQLQVFDYIAAAELTAESERLCSGLGQMHLSTVRYNSKSNSYWALASKPDAVLNIDGVSGQVRGVAEMSAPVYALDVHTEHPDKALVCGMKENITEVELLPSM